PPRSSMRASLSLVSLHPDSALSPTTVTMRLCTLSLHDALPIYSPPAGTAARGTLQFYSDSSRPEPAGHLECGRSRHGHPDRHSPDRKSTRLNSSHVKISYAVFCLKKKKYKRRSYGLLLYTC